MNILIVNDGLIPVKNYGGTERVIWYLGKELSKMGHSVTYLVRKGSHCNFAKVLFYDNTKSVAVQIPASIDIVHFNFQPAEPILKPYIVSFHGNCNDFRLFDLNTVFVSQNHAERFGSNCFIYNGMDWDDYTNPDLLKERKYFHFLGNAAWRIKNVKGAIKIINNTKKEKLKVLGGNRLNFNMGFRFTLSPRVTFYGMVGGDKKFSLLAGSKGLIFPVRWHEPFGIAITESLYFGCPIFGTPYGSLKEIVQTDIGFLSFNSNILSEQIEDSARFSKKRCHDYALDIFNSKIMAEKYLQKYEQVINGNTLNKIAPQLVQLQQEKFLPFN